MPGRSKVSVSARCIVRLLACLLLGGASMAGAQTSPAAAPVEEKAVSAGPYVPTPWPIVDEFLKMADIGKDDVVYDLGSGDGRLVITAAKRYGARGVGIEIQPQLVELANRQAAEAGVAGRVSFHTEDLFKADYREASVITLYLLPRFVPLLVPKFRAELKPGTRIVSHDYALTPWPPDKVLTFDVPEKEQISGTTRTVLFYYVVPARLAGRWELSVPRSLIAAPFAISVTQDPEVLTGFAHIGSEMHPLRDFVAKGTTVRFGVFAEGKLMNFIGEARDNEISGIVELHNGGRENWSARRSGS
jgi:SAM-dependent methyltransferase